MSTNELGELCIKMLVHCMIEGYDPIKRYLNGIFGNQQKRNSLELGVENIYLKENEMKYSRKYNKELVFKIIKY